MNVLLLCRKNVLEKIVKIHNLKKDTFVYFFDRKNATDWLLKEKQKPNFIIVDERMRNKTALVFLREIKKMKLNATIMRYIKEKGEKNGKNVGSNFSGIFRQCRK